MKDLDSDKRRQTFRYIRVVLGLCLLLPAVSLGQSLLQVSPDRRSLEYSDGKPFLYLGDTAWELFHRLDRNEARRYLENRAAKGFTVIQAVVLAEIDGLRTPNAYGELPLIDLDPARPNEKYFEFVDYVVESAQDLGLWIGMLPTWGDKLYSIHPGAGPLVFDSENAYAYGLFLGRRYRDKPIIWILGGDRRVATKEVLQIWRAMARGLEEGDSGRHLITFHPRGGTNSSDWFHNEPWLDFNMYQSGHASMHPVYRYAERSRLLDPPKPVVDGEPAYEDIPVRFWEFMDFDRPGRERVPEGVLSPEGKVVRREHFADGFITAHDVRVHAYWNLLAGAAGYTYGNNAIWQMWEPGDEVAIPTIHTWEEALDRPGAQDIRHIRDLFESRDFSRLVPDQSLVYGPNPEGPEHIRSARADNGTFAYVYLSRGQSVDVFLSKLSGPQVSHFWFNPRNGESEKVGTLPSEGIVEFHPPTQGPETDWLLILETEGLFSYPPGQPHR